MSEEFIESDSLYGKPDREWVREQLSKAEARLKEVPEDMVKRMYAFVERSSRA